MEVELDWQLHQSYFEHCSDSKLTKAYIENERSECSFENSWISVDSMVTRHGRPVLFALDGFALRVLSLDLSSIDNFVE